MERKLHLCNVSILSAWFCFCLDFCHEEIGESDRHFRSHGRTLRFPQGLCYLCHRDLIVDQILQLLLWNIEFRSSGGTARHRSCMRAMICSLSNKTVTVDIQCTTSLNLSDCTRWRFICCNRKIAKSTVPAFPPDCNLLARSKRECLKSHLVFGRVRHFQKASTSQGFVGLRTETRSRNRWIWGFDEFRSLMNLIVR